MSAGVATAARVEAEPRPRLSFSPVEGWLTLISAALMVVVFALSLIEAGWTGRSGGSQAFLVWVGLLGFAIGVVGAKIGWGRWRTHIIGALLGGILLLLIMGGVALDERFGWSPADMATRFAAAVWVLNNVWIDLVVNGAQYTNQIDHYHLIFGALVYGAGLLTGFTVFGHRRPLDAVVVVGLATLANMAITQNDQLYLLVLFSASALFLLIRTHVFEEEATWTRRKIGDPSVVGELLVRGGTAFVTLAIVGSILLTFTASSAPLKSLWADLPRQMQDLAKLLQKIAPPGGNLAPTGGIGFSSSAQSRGIWSPSNEVAFRAQFDPAETERFKWRAGTYAVYTRAGWDWDGGEVQRRPIPVGPNDTLTTTTFRDAAGIVGFRDVAINVSTDDFRDLTILSPLSVRLVDRPTNVIVVGDDAWFTSIESREGTSAYGLTAFVPVAGNGPSERNEARLRTAGTEYPAELEEIYTALPQDSLGPFARALLGDIRDQVAAPPGYDPDNPYDLARTTETYLQSERFQYVENIVEVTRSECPAGDSTVECFARIKQGYCEYYASTMAVLLRESGVPARIAYGFLPAERVDGLETVTGAAMHWWVEVYFPGIGWFEFDPTGGGRGEPTAIPSGSLSPETARPTGGTFTPPPSRNVATLPPDDDDDEQGLGIFPIIGIGLILMVGIVALAMAVIRRTPNKPMHPDQAWGALGRLASRFGLGPRPSQTVYEYAGALGDAVPTARVELTTIARAKVEVAYGRQDLGGDRLKRIAEAYHHLRLAIIGVVLRRFLRRPRRDR